MLKPENGMIWLEKDLAHNNQNASERLMLPFKRLTGWYNISAEIKRDKRVKRSHIKITCKGSASKALNTLSRPKMWKKLIKSSAPIIQLKVLYNFFIFH